MGRTADAMTADLFAAESGVPAIETLAPGAVILRDFAGGLASQLARDALAVAQASPFRNLVTPGGFTMSVAMTNCGRLGWVSDRRGYRYDSIDPLTRKPWPPMPQRFLDLAARAAGAAGFGPFVPDACLINRYVPGARLSLHQDRDEGNLQAPIVSASLGLPATFLFGGRRRADRTLRTTLLHGDVVVFGGPSRLAYHGVAPLAAGHHHELGAQRINLTFRCAR